VATQTKSLIVWAPGIPNPAPPVYQQWSDIEAVVNSLEGAVRLMVDMTGLPGFAQVPATANLDGRGRMEIVGAGPRGEVQMEMLDGAVIKNVREWRTVVVRATPTIRVPIQFDINGLVVEGFDATFQFGANTATLPVIQTAPGIYTALLFNVSGQLRNSHNPGKAVLDIGAGSSLLMAVAANVFGVTFVDTISGPVGTSIDLQIDSTLVPPTFAAFFGTLSVTQVSTAAGTAYAPAVPANWVGTPPATVQEALDRIAAAVGPIP
jgi:hypothetical protein